ncbi:DUF308 domain-containing protein [Chloroflexi bacterium TSY]|nr:DUF308 domain-containing protein [Chloroflexi bacterium TSY]
MTALSTQDPQNSFSSLWWIPLMRGLMLILFGILMLLRPGATLIILIQVMGAYFLISGIFDIVEAFMGDTDRSRVWMVIGGVISILAGFIVIGQPIAAGFLTATLLVYLVGFAAIIGGVMYIFGDRSGHWMWGNLWLGLLYIIFGLILIFNPLLTEGIVILLLPWWAIVTGAFSIVRAFMLRNTDV